MKITYVCEVCCRENEEDFEPLILSEKETATTVWDICPECKLKAQNQEYYETFMKPNTVKGSFK